MKLAGENVCSVLSLNVFGTFGTLAFWLFGKIAFRLCRCSMDDDDDIGSLATVLLAIA